MLFKPNFRVFKQWREAQEDGRRKARWDGNGREREWEKKREREKPSKPLRKA